VRFIDLSPDISSQLNAWLKAAANTAGAGPNETVPHCKLTDLSLGGCYLETEAPFPERALVDICLKTEEFEVHTEGMVRVTHPGRGMGIEFPSRTEEQRAQVGNLISFLRGSPEAMLELMISPRALVADLKQFEPEENVGAAGEDMDDPLLELLRRGSSLHEDDFLDELREQRSPVDVASL
jgi:hypothetical protein